MTATNGFTTSLTLTGPGSYASYEVGVMAALFAGRCPSTNYAPLDPDLLIGTSAGAMNILILAADEVRTGSLVAAVAELATAWTQSLGDGPNRCGNGAYRIRGLPFGLFDPDCLWRGLAPFLAEASADITVLIGDFTDVITNLFKSESSPLAALAESLNLSSLISTVPFLETLGRILSLDDLGRSTRRLRVAAMDLTAGQLKLFTEDDVRRIGYLPLLASAALPVYFPPILIGGHEFVNATTLASTPLLPAIRESDTMHIIYMDPDLRSIRPIRLENIVDSIDRMIVINFAYMLNSEIEFAHEINTSLELINAGATAESLTPLEVHALLRSLARIRDRIEAGNP
jgi:predicted acylesterase/phospholipase RssA